MLTSATALRGLRASTACKRSVLNARMASGAPHYNEPSGYFLGEKPPPPGEKRAKEAWENMWYIGMFGSMVFASVMLYYKPDTSVQSWALKEAKERMEARGEKYQYEPESTPTSSSS